MHLIHATKKLKYKQALNELEGRGAYLHTEDFNCDFHPKEKHE